MGYDIFSQDENREVAEAHARKWRREGFFSPVDEKGDYIGGDSVYFRLNIWGMGMLRMMLWDLGATAPLGALSDNSGQLITPEECLLTAAVLSSVSDEKIKDVAGAAYIHETDWMRTAGLNDEKPPTDAQVEEEATSWIPLVREFEDYLIVCASLGGAVVC